MVEGLNGWGVASCFARRSLLPRR